MLIIREGVKVKKKSAVVENEKVIILIGILLFIAGIGVNIARVAWQVAGLKSFIWNVVFLIAYMVVFETVKIISIYKILKEEYELLVKKSKKTGKKIQQKTDIDLLFEASRYKEDKTK